MPSTASTDAAALFALEVEAIYELDAAGRLLRRSSPDRLEAPRLFLASCAGGRVLRVRHDVPETTRLALERVAASEPSWAGFDSAPTHLEEYRRILAADAPVAAWHTELVWTFPEPFAFKQSVDLVRSGTDRGDRLLATLDHDGMPEALVTAGFLDSDGLWAPWCAVIDGGAIASLASTVAAGAASAEVGLFTFPAFRGRGLGAAATAGWAAHPALAGKTLFYGTDRENVSSQRVVERLGLPFLGTSLSIT